MGIRWRPLRKRRCVKNILKAHDARSSRCREAAEGVILVARSQDAKARFWLLRPSPECGPVAKILPSVKGAQMWFYHVCVETERHCVCALTGASGAPRRRYVEQHFQYAADVVRTKIEDERALHTALFGVG